MPNDRGDIVLGWLTKLAVVLALLFLVGYDGVSLAVAHVNATDAANSAALTASESWTTVHNAQRAFEAAEADLAGNGGGTIDPKSFRIDADNTVHLVVHRTATTLLVYRTKTTAKWARIVEDGSGRSA